MTKKASSQPRPSYSLEQKLHAVRLVREQSLAITEVCKNLSISSSAMKNWLKQYDAGVLGSGLPHRSITPEQQRIRELERKNSQLEHEVAILKKASAFFARELL